MCQFNNDNDKRISAELNSKRKIVKTIHLADVIVVIVSRRLLLQCSYTKVDRTARNAFLWYLSSPCVYRTFNNSYYDASQPQRPYNISMGGHFSLFGSSFYLYLYTYIYLYLYIYL